MGPKMLIEVDGKILFIVRMPRLCSVVLGGLKMTTKKPRRMAHIAPSVM